jgi:hypothetical protein
LFDKEIEQEIENPDEGTGTGAKFYIYKTSISKSIE